MLQMLMIARTPGKHLWMCHVWMKLVAVHAASQSQGSRAGLAGQPATARGEGWQSVAERGALAALLLGGPRGDASSSILT